MAVLTTIDGVPLYTTVQEALNWATAHGCSGYHVHNYQGQAGYMGCATHANTPSIAQNTPPSTPSSGGSGGGTGGY